MTSLKFAFTLIAVLLLQGCETQGQYPVSGEQCGPEDPVKELDAGDCMPPAGI